jgi:hypothetical protein
MLVRVVYVSRATQEFSEDELLNMLKNARPRNEEHGISGMLLYSNKNFIQVLEGEKKPIDQLYSNITKDERHKDVKLIDYSEITQRSFPKWSMGFKMIDSQTKLDGFSEFMQRPMTPKELSQNPTSVIGLLYSFRSQSSTVNH